MIEDVPAIFDSIEALHSAATEIAAKAPTEYQHSVYLYFIARYFVAVYEAIYSEVPIQVWNEYRNALDHFFRSITRTSEEKKQLSRVEGHLQRAVLDISKIYCHRTEERFESTLSTYKVADLRLVDSGVFYRVLLDKHDEARDIFTRAKTTDNRLGEDRGTNTQVLSDYLSACFKYKDLLKFLTDRRNDLENLVQELHYRKTEAANEARKHSFKDHIVASLTAKLIWYIVGAAVLTTIGLQFF